jgi:L-asparaginase/Glu-tRNA(Gln) amidotransferase subunit D
MENEMTIIYLITTGGTIEKVYSEQTGSVQNVDNKIDRYLRMLRLPDSEVRVMPLMNKDSLEMTDADRAVILKTVKDLLPENAPIVITHGTDTMVATGLYLQRAIPEPKIRIVLTASNTRAGIPARPSARTKRADDAASPVASSVASADLSGFAQIFSARRNNWLAVSPKAETTAVTCSPARHAR